MHKIIIGVVAVAVIGLIAYYALKYTHAGSSLFQVDTRSQNAPEEMSGSGNAISSGWPFLGLTDTGQSSSADTSSLITQTTSPVRLSLNQYQDPYANELSYSSPHGE